MAKATEQVSSGIPSQADGGTRIGWRISQFCRAAGIGRSTFYALPKEQKPRSVKMGRSRIIVEAPTVWLRRIGDSE